MNIQILDSWLREYLITNAKPQNIADSLSLCGPSVDRLEAVKTDTKLDYLYDIEITTNRVDAMSVMGIAREAAVILPEFGFRAKFNNYSPKFPKPTGGLSINLHVDTKLSTRVMGVILEIDQVSKSPKWLQNRLESSGVRSINLPVDITNYVMLDVGHPTHVFDYDLVAPDMVLRQAKSGEKIVSLDNKSYKLAGGDIVIDNGEGKIIDLPGIIGTKNSVVNSKTKRILYFMETNDPLSIRKTSLRLGIRTNAAILNEKGVDPYLAETAMGRGLDMFQKLMNAKVRSKIYDIFPVKPLPKTVELQHAFIEKILGVHIPSSQVRRILNTLGFNVVQKGDNYKVTPPTFRSKDVEIPEDVVEEVARIYGYHKLPSTLPTGKIPLQISDSPFEFENKIKNLLIAMGAVEIYTNSLVSSQMVTGKALKILNPLGTDTSCLRNSLLPSLVASVNANKNIDSFHLFELSNIYIPQKGLPLEIMTLSGIIKGFKYKDAKGVVDTMLDKLRIKPRYLQVDKVDYKPNHRIELKGLGEFGVLTNDYFYYSFEVEKLQNSQGGLVYKPIPKYPTQIEDITIKIPDGVHIVDVVASIQSVDPKISNVELIDSYKSNYTFRIDYQDPDKTLDDKEVAHLRAKVISKAKTLGLSVTE